MGNEQSTIAPNEEQQRLMLQARLEQGRQQRSQRLASLEKDHTYASSEIKLEPKENADGMAADTRRIAGKQIQDTEGLAAAKQLAAERIATAKAMRAKEAERKTRGEEKKEALEQKKADDRDGEGDETRELTSQHGQKVSDVMKGLGVMTSTQGLPVRPSQDITATSSSSIITITPSPVDSPLAGWNTRKEPLQRNTENGNQRRRSSTDSDAVDEPAHSPRSHGCQESLQPISPGVVQRNESEGSTTAQKRPAPPSGMEMRMPGKILKRASNTAAVNSLQSAVDVSDSETDLGRPYGASGQREPPSWYTTLKVNKTRDANSSNADTLLQRLKEKITAIKRLFSPGSVSEMTKEVALNNLRTMIHKIFFVEVSAKLVRNNRMLDNANGLPQIFDQRYADGVPWPFDVKADAEELYNKWCRRVFETDLMRGIDYAAPKAKSRRTINSNSHGSRLKPDYQIPARYHGNGKLLNGQWWPIQLAAQRDGAHGESQAGICGGKGDGAYSVIMSGGKDSSGSKYPDEDRGNEVLYCGTDSESGEPTQSTQRMLESVGGEPVRFIRSSNADSRWAPELGFRYDGLYNVVKAEMLDPHGPARQRHRFTLVRQPGQDPIRGGDSKSLARRPTTEEVVAFGKDKTLRGYGAKAGA